MPYVDDERRALLGENFTWQLNGVNGMLSSGELNYMLTEVVIAYLLQNGLTYQTCNDIVGALDNCKDEFRRRVQHLYEDGKIAANGDVYPVAYTSQSQ